MTELIKVKVASIGSARDIEIIKGTTVAELLCRLDYYDDDERVVRVNGLPTFPKDVLCDGDIVVTATPIRGEAPLMPTQTDLGIRQLQEFTIDAENLILVDPYILKPRRGQDAESHVNLLSNCIYLNHRGLNNIHVIYSWRYHRSKVLSLLTEACSQHNCNLIHNHTSDIHDRIWIKNREEAIIIGTSLNSIGGKKLAFIVELPRNDLDYLLCFLKNKKLI